MRNKQKNERAEGLQNSMNCARWLVQQFESLDCKTIAGLFQRAVDDSDAWIQMMAISGRLPRESADPIRAREVALIHNLLVKYASIEDPAARQTILGDMMASLNQDTERRTRGKRHAGRS